MDTNGDFWGLDIFFINQSPIIVQCTVILLEMGIHYWIFWKSKYALPVMCKNPNIFGFMRIYSDSNNEKNPNANLELLHPVSLCYVGVGTDNQYK